MIIGLHQIIAIAVKNLKIKFRSYQTYLYAFGFPLLFTFIFLFVFNSIEVPGGYNVFDLAFSSVLIYAASFGTINAAVSLTSEKHRGTLMRLDTTPIGRTKIFIGTLVSESVFLAIQLLLMVFLGYGLLGVRFHEQNVLLLLIGLLIIFIFGISTLGIGIVISAYAKTADTATGISMCYVMPVLFLSGIFIPFDSPIVYLFPPFWVNQIFQQVVMLGDNVITDSFRYHSLNIFSAEFTVIPLWGAIVIIVIATLTSLYGAIQLFQRKTLVYE
ncbi:MAG: ABC transporter permease [Candidatus Hodarchaeales archaeon]|jgi:ABC-type transport system involved in multi-copper enzyme maturation permease subunit